MTSMTRVENTFNFRTKNGYKRPSVSVEYDAPNADGLVSLLQGDDPKVVELITDSVHNVIQNHIRSYVDADLEFNQESLEALAAQGKVSLEHIAHIPKADRNTLNKDDLEQFAQDYMAVMPELTGKDPARVQAAANLYLERFKRAAGDNNVLSILRDQLDVFVDGAGEEVLARNEKVVTWAAGKLDELLSIKVTADAL